MSSKNVLCGLLVYRWKYSGSKVLCLLALFPLLPKDLVTTSVTGQSSAEVYDQLREAYIRVFVCKDSCYIL